MTDAAHNTKSGIFYNEAATGHAMGVEEGLRQVVGGSHIHLGVPCSKALAPAWALSFSSIALTCHPQPHSFLWFNPELGLKCKGILVFHVLLPSCLPHCCCLFIEKLLQVIPRNCLPSLYGAASLL